MGRIVEINGLKMDVDYQTATVSEIDKYKVGDNVKVLRKKYQAWKIYPGVITGFCDFKNMPSIEILIIENDFGSPTIEFITYNNESEDIEIRPMSDDNIEIPKDYAFQMLRDEILRKSLALKEAKRKLDVFSKFFNMEVSSIKIEEKL